MVTVKLNYIFKVLLQSFKLTRSLLDSKCLFVSEAEYEGVLKNILAENFEKDLRKTAVMMSLVVKSGSVKYIFLKRFFKNI